MAIVTRVGRAGPVRGFPHFLQLVAKARWSITSRRTGRQSIKWFAGPGRAGGRDLEEEEVAVNQSEARDSKFHSAGQLARGRLRSEHLAGCSIIRHR